MPGLSCKSLHGVCRYEDFRIYLTFFSGSPYSTWANSYTIEHTQYDSNSNSHTIYDTHHDPYSHHDAYTYTNTSYKFGKAGHWNSSFTFGGGVPSSSSQGMTDNDTPVIASNGVNQSHGIAGDGWAGIMGINVSGSTFTVDGVSSMSGTIDQATGDMNFDPTGRFGAVSGLGGTLYNEAWNLNPGATTYQHLSTVSASSGSTVGVDTNTIDGNPFALISGTSNYAGTLVSGGWVGDAWTGFTGDGYFEVWKAELLSTSAPHSGFNVDPIIGTAGGTFAEKVAPVPIPAAAWLFGSGLIGLVGIARRKKSS